jgi:hypothetical protein
MSGQGGQPPIAPDHHCGTRLGDNAEHVKGDERSAQALSKSMVVHSPTTGWKKAVAETHWVARETGQKGDAAASQVYHETISELREFYLPQNSPLAGWRASNEEVISQPIQNVPG